MFYAGWVNLYSLTVSASEIDLFSFSPTQSAHMPMIDALMMAYTVEMISIEKVVASVKRFSTFSASKELPFDLEDAMVFWINKVWTHRHDLVVVSHRWYEYRKCFRSACRCNESLLFCRLTWRWGRSQRGSTKSSTTPWSPPVIKR